MTPQIDIPDTFMGRKVDGAIERVLAKDRKREQMAVEPRQIAPIKTNLKNPQDFVQIPNTNYVIAKLQGHNNLTYENAHRAVLNEGYFMPSPALFVKYVMSVKDAADGKLSLYDGKNNLLSKTEARELWGYLSSKDRKNHGDLWVWLNARFVEGTGHNKLDIETITGLDKGKNLVSKKELLGKCIFENGYADLAFNSQGLPVKKSLSQDYKQGENLYFWHPRENAVARFGADSDWSILYCYGYPLSSDSALGVLACAEGAEIKV